MKATHLHHVYGPVPSRRLGRSLGVDLVPFKVCCYDCVYCQLGPTTELTVTAGNQPRVDVVLAEVVQALARGPRPDVIALAGSGEPTLHAGIGALIRALQRETEIPVAVLTNGGLLSRPAVRKALAPADIVLPSLDAGDAQSFALVNRPHASIDFDEMVAGLVAFGDRGRGQMWLEVLLVAGLTDTPEQLEAIATHANRIAPTKVQLTTVVRPAPGDAATAVSIDTLDSLARMLDVPVEIVAPAGPRADNPAVGVTREAVLALLARRPCSADDVARGLSAHRNEAVKCLATLLASEAVSTVRRDGTLYYQVARTKRAC